MFIVFTVSVVPFSKLPREENNCDIWLLKAIARTTRTKRISIVMAITSTGRSPFLDILLNLFHILLRAEIPDSRAVYVDIAGPAMMLLVSNLIAV